MENNKNMKMRVITSIASILVLTVSYGQFGEGVVIEATGERTVEQAQRTSVKPQIIDTNVSTPIVNYPLLALQGNTTTDVDKIDAAAIKVKEKLPQLYNTYVKLGVGSELMPLGEIYFDSKRSRKYIYGAHVKHLSSWGNIPGYAPATFDRTKGLIYGGINERTYSLRGDVHYNNQGLHYYAYPTDSLIVADSIAQRYSDFGISGQFSHHKKDSAHLNYNVGLEYNNFMSKKPNATDREDWRAKENFVGVYSRFMYKYKAELFAADFNVRYNGYKYGIEDSTFQNVLDSGIVLNNTVINLKPTITTLLWNNRFKAVFGADLVFDVHNRTKVYVYPQAEIKYSMFNDIFIPYAGLRGGLQQNTFKSLTRENEFLQTNVNMLNQSTPIDFYGGIKGTLSKRISFNTSISFANVRNMALFVNDTIFSMGNQYNVIFDTVNVTAVEGSISYQLREKLKLDGIGRFNSYSALNNSYAWNKPQLQFIIRGSYNLFDKFLFNVDLNMESGRKALVYEPGEDVKLENNQYVKTLNFIADANLGVEYRYNKRISAFIQTNNIASQRYMRWYNAPVHSFQVMGGVTFRF